MAGQTDAENAVLASLYWWRMEMGFTQTMAAQRVGVNRTTFWRWECNKIDVPPPAVKLMALMIEKTRQKRRTMRTRGQHEQHREEQD